MSTNLPPQPNAMPILSVRNLVTEVATPDGRRTVVDDLSFDLATGETLCIAGESGSGENTWQRNPSRAAASASIRPNWPPPRIPMVSPGFSFT